MADDEDEAFGGLYENGHWVWDDHTQALVFVSDLPPMKVEAIQIPSKAPTGAIEFRDDIDLIEQLRFKRRYQRKPKPGQEDLVTLQDIKDIAIYTAPIGILSPMLIDMLHLATTERFLRALIYCCAYYLQVFIVARNSTIAPSRGFNCMEILTETVHFPGIKINLRDSEIMELSSEKCFVADEMAVRMLERETKIRTNKCEILENELRSNLSDLRVLVAKEYCVLLIGGGDMKKFHHMGSNKKRRSLSDKDARLFETFAHMSVQIVYLALGRKNYRQIELECHRVFKTDIFNTVEHTYKTGYLSQMTPEERKVLLGTCIMYEKKLNTRSPLINEVFCQEPIDFRMMGLGVVKYEKITARLHYFYLIVAGPEQKLRDAKLTVGIIGMRRCLFDIMLHPISVPAQLGDKSKGSISKSHVKSSAKSQGTPGASFKSMTGKSLQTIQRCYPEIILPRKDPIDSTLPSDFPEVPEDDLHVSHVQRRRWQNRLIRLTTVTA